MAGRLPWLFSSALERCYSSHQKVSRGFPIPFQQGHNTYDTQEVRCEILHNNPQADIVCFTLLSRENPPAHDAPVGWLPWTFRDQPILRYHLRMFPPLIHWPVTAGNGWVLDLNEAPPIHNIASALNVRHNQQRKTNIANLPQVRPITSSNQGYGLFNSPQCAQ